MDKWEAWLQLFFRDLGQAMHKPAEYYLHICVADHNTIWCCWQKGSISLMTGRSYFTYSLETQLSGGLFSSYPICKQKFTMNFSESSNETQKKEFLRNKHQNLVRTCEMYDFYITSYQTSVGPRNNGQEWTLHPHLEKWGYLYIIP